MALVVSLWLLLGPPDRGDHPVWVIRGGYDSRGTCETFRERNPNPHWLLCATVGGPVLEPSAQTAVHGAPPAVSGFRDFPPGALERARPTAESTPNGRREAGTPVR